MTSPEITAEQERIRYREQVKEAFSIKGYKPTSKESLQDFVDKMAFEPDLFIERGPSERVAVVIRETAEFDAGDWLAEQVATRRGYLKDTIVCLLLQHAGLLGYRAIEGSLRSGVDLYTLNSSGLRLLFGPHYGGKVFRIEKETRDSVLERYSKNKRIPVAISSSLGRVSNLEYADILRDLSADYERKRISSHEEESKLMLNYLKLIIERVPEGEKVGKAVDLLRILEELLHRDGKTRDHFFHQFLTFLLGSVAIDANYSEMSGWYKSLFPESPKAKLDLVWVLASHCHDLLSPFESPGLAIGAYAVSIDHRPQYIRHPAEVLNSFYIHMSREEIRCDWDLDSHRPREGPLSDILVKYANLGNHGVNMALELVSRGLNYPPRMLSSYICPAAMAIAFHDKKIWSELIESQIFPIDVERFPIAFLLMYCDGVQEWGRPGKAFDPMGEHSALVDFKAERGKVSSTLWFKDKARACLSKFLHDYISDRCIKSRAITFEVDVCSD